MKPDDPSLDPDGTTDHKPASPIQSQRETVSVSQQGSIGAPQQNIPALPTGAPSISGYRITGEIAKGGMGRIYAAVDVTLDREVAIKTLLPGANAARFVTESKITAKLPHPGVPPVHALGTLANAAPYLVMKLIRGRTLGELLNERLSPREELPRFIQIFEQIAQAVGFAHSRGIIHRDLKPLNVMVGEFGEVQVMDWGLAKDSSRSDPTEQSTEENEDIHLTQAGAIMGTPGYMAPEQARGEVVDARADVFALGATLAAILTSQPAFVGNTVRETVNKAASADMTDVFTRLDACGVDEELVALAKACLAAKVEDRPADARQVAALASAYRAGVEKRLQASETQRAEALVRETEQRKRRRVTRIAGGLLATVLAVGAAVSSYFAYAAIRQAERADGEAKTAREQTVRADLKAVEAARQTVAAQDAEKLARDRETSERQAKFLATQEAERADREWKRAEAEKVIALQKGDLAESLVYSGKLALTQAGLAANNPGVPLRFLLEAQSERRGWEHDLLWTLATPEQTLWGHRGSVTAVSYSSDGARILTASEDGTARLWDAETGREQLALHSPGGPVQCAAFDPVGLTVATGYYKAVCIWDAKTGSQLDEFTHRSATPCLAFSPDGKQIVTGTGDVTYPKSIGEAVFWDLNQRRPVRTFKTTGDRVVTAMAYNPDGSRLATGGSDKSVRIWEVATGRELFRLAQHPASLTGVAFSPDGSILATTCKDSRCRLWDAPTGRPIRELVGHKLQLNELSFHPDGETLVTVSDDGTARMWEARTGNLLRTYVVSKRAVRAVAFSPDGSRFVTGSDDGQARTWDANVAHDSRVLRGHASELTALAISPDGTRVATCGADRTVKIWDARTGAEVLALRGHKRPINAAAFSPDGKGLVTGAGAGVGIGSGELRAWNPATGEELALFPPRQSAAVSALAFNPDGTRLVVCDHNTAKILDAATGQPVLTLQGQAGRMVDVAFSPNHFLVAGLSGPSAKVWDARTGKELWKIPMRFGDRYSGVAFSPDSRRLVIASSAQNQAQVWDLETRKVLLTLRGHTESIRCVAYSPDGKHIVTGSGGMQANTKSAGEIKLWDAAKGQELLTLKGHSGWVTRVAFSTDGRRLVSSSSDGTARIWTTERSVERKVISATTSGTLFLGYCPEGKRLLRGADGMLELWDTTTFSTSLTFRGHVGRVGAACVSPDGMRILTGSYDKTARLWDAATGKLLKILKPHGDEVGCVAISPNGRLLLTGEGNLGGSDTPSTAKLWDAVTGRLLFSLKGHSKGITGLAFSPDGSRCLTASRDATAKVWDTATGQDLLNLKGHLQELTRAAFSPDGRYVLTGSRGLDLRSIRDREDIRALATDLAAAGKFQDRFEALRFGRIAEVRLWDAATGQLIHDLRGTTQDVTAVGFSGDGKRAFVWTMSGICHAWAVADGSPAPLEGAIAASVTSGFPPQLALSAIGLDRTQWAELRGGELLLVDLRRSDAQNVWRRPDPEQRRALHARLARIAEAKKRWFAAVFHLGRLLLDDQANAELKRRIEAVEKARIETPEQTKK